MSFFNADILVSSTDGLLLKDLGDNATTPSSGYGSVYVNDDAIYFKSDGGNTTNLLTNNFPNSIETINTIGNTWVAIPSNTKLILLKSCASGGGGGGPGTTGGDSGGGGGSGAYSEVYLKSGDIASNPYLNISIGAGGTAGSTEGNGGNGSDLTIKFASSNTDTSGDQISLVDPGKGGYHGNNYGRGGINGKLADSSIDIGIGIILNGRVGDQGRDQGGSTSNNYSTGGNGGDSMLGCGAIGATGSSNSNFLTGEYGGGGGGGVSNSSSNKKLPSAGATGVCFIYFY